MKPYGATEPVPYSHKLHAARCSDAARVREVLAATFVQVKSGPVVYCGRILAAWDHPDAGEMWKLEVVTPLPGVRSFPARRARLCSGIDGRCVCEHLAAHQAERVAPARGAACGFGPGRSPEGQVTC